MLGPNAPKKGTLGDEGLSNIAAIEMVDACFSCSGRYHGRTGEMTVDTKRFETEVGKHFLEAGKELGFDIIDENTEESIGRLTLCFMNFILRRVLRYNLR